MPAENYGAAEVLAKGVLLTRALEVAFSQGLRYGLDGAVAVDSLSRFAQMLFVDVRRINFDTAVELIWAHRLGEHHRNRISLFAGRAAGGPDANRAVCAVMREDVRHDFAFEIVPGLRVPEEGRDVDQHGVEEVGELVLMDFQVVDIIAKGLYFDRRHALLNASR